MTPTGFEALVAGARLAVVFALVLVAFFGFGAMVSIVGNTLGLELPDNHVSVHSHENFVGFLCDCLPVAARVLRSILIGIHCLNVSL